KGSDGAREVQCGFGHLAGVQDPLRIQGLLDRHHDAERLATLVPKLDGQAWRRRTTISSSPVAPAHGFGMRGRQPARGGMKLVPRIVRPLFWLALGTAATVLVGACGGSTPTSSGSVTFKGTKMVGYS